MSFREKLFLSNKTTNVRRASKLYLDLCDAIEVVNSTCTFHLIFVTISCSVSMPEELLELIQIPSSSAYQHILRLRDR